MLKSIKIWLVLLPIISIIGIILYVQSYNNQKELENQLIRSVEASKNDVLRALGDYYDRVDSYFLQHGSAVAAKDPTNRSESTRLVSFSKFVANYTNAKFIEPGEAFKDSLYFKNNAIVKTGLAVNILGLAKEFDLGEFAKEFKVSYDTAILKQDSLVLLVDVEIPTVDLLRKQESSKIFDHFYLTDKSGLIVYPDTEYGVSLFNPKEIVVDTLGVTHAGTSTLDLSLSGTPSRAYVSPIPFENQKLYAVGLLSKDAYQKVGLRLDFGKMSVFLLFLFVLVALIPVLGVMNLSIGDNLNQGKVTYVGLSLMSLTLIIGYSTSQFKNLPDPVEQQKEIASSLESEVARSLNLYDSTLSTLVKNDNWKSSDPPFNELIEFMPNGFVRKIQYRSDRQMLDFKDTLATTSIDLSSRAYYGYYYDPYGKLKSDKTSDVFVNSHYSRFDAQLETVISKYYPKKDSANRGVRAITFKLLTDSSYSSNYRYLVIKKDGKILLKSNKISSPIENLQEAINQEKWEEISALIDNNKDSKQELKTSLYLNGNHYTGILRKIQGVTYDQDLWLLFLVNNNLSYAFSALSTAESTFLVFLYFLSLLFSLVIQKNARRSKNKYGTKAFLYSWLEPSPTNLPRLNYLTIAYIVYAAALALVYYFFRLNHNDFLILMIFSTYLVSFVNLSTSSIVDEEDNYNSEIIVRRYTARSIILGAINIILLLSILFFSSALIIPAILLAALCCTIILLWHLKFKATWVVAKDMKNLTLPTFIALWFFVIGFLPGYFIQSKTQQFDQTIWEQSLSPTKNSPQMAEHQSSEIKAADYEFSRRKFLTMIADPFDQKIRDYISPDEAVFESALSAKKIGFPGLITIGRNVLISATLLILFILFVNIIYKIVFFPIPVLPEPEIDFGKKKLFLVSSESGQTEKIIKATAGLGPIQTINLQTIGSLAKIPFDVTMKRYHLMNLHCVDNQMEILPVISKIEEQGKQLILSSGKSWHELMISISEIKDQVKYSEMFTDFGFRTFKIDLSGFPSSVIPHKAHHLQQKAQDEMLMQLEVAKFADIWSELNFQEKLVCHSFVMERFLNHSRRKTIQGLLRKGILIESMQESSSAASQPEESDLSTVTWKKLEFFSRLFQTYILNHVSKEEIKSFRDFESKNGNAHLVQVSTFSFVLICFALIGIFDKTFFDEIYAYLTGSIGLIGSIYTILNGGFSGLKLGKSKS